MAILRSHGCGAGMVKGTGNLYPEPVSTPDAGHYADLVSVLLKLVSLFNVKFEVRDNPVYVCLGNGRLVQLDVRRIKALFSHGVLQLHAGIGPAEQICGHFIPECSL